MVSATSSTPSEAAGRSGADVEIMRDSRIGVTARRRLI
jgi:hypothetical protein